MVDADAQTRNAKREDAPCAMHHAPLAMGNVLMCGTRRTRDGQCVGVRFAPMRDARLQ